MALPPDTNPNPRSACAARTRAGTRCHLAVPAGSRYCERHGDPAERARQKVAARLRALAPRALEALQALMDQAEQDAVRLQAARDVLDRAGYKAPSRHEVSGPAGHPVAVELVYRDESNAR